jgi:hypothetical protein
MRNLNGKQNTSMRENPKFNRTLFEEQMKRAFSKEYYEIITKIKKIIYEEIRKAKVIKDPEIQFEQCMIAIKTYELARLFCYSKGQGGRIYFDDLYEHCHNSKNPCFSFLEDTVSKMDSLFLKLYI